VEEWHIPRKLQVSECTTNRKNTDHKMTEHLTSGSIDDISRVQKATSLQNVPFLHTSTQRSGTSLHVTSSTRPSSALVLQATNAGVKRPVCEARRQLPSSKKKNLLIISSLSLHSVMGSLHALLPLKLITLLSTYLYITYFLCKVYI